jgi:hypothetical protein
MKYSVEIGSGAIIYIYIYIYIYIPGFIKIGSGIRNLKRGISRHIEHIGIA